MYSFKFFNLSFLFINYLFICLFIYLYYIYSSIHSFIYPFFIFRYIFFFFHLLRTGFFYLFFGRGGMISIIHSNFTANTHSVEKRYSSFVVKIETYSRINYQLKETEGLKAIAWHGYERMECHSFILYHFSDRDSQYISLV